MTDQKIIYNNNGYELIYNSITKTIKELQDGEIISESETINIIKDLSGIENSFYTDWKYVGFQFGEAERNFFNKIKNILRSDL